MVRRLKFHQVGRSALDFAEQIIRNNIVPPEKGADAAHLAISAVNGVDYC